MSEFTYSLPPRTSDEPFVSGPRPPIRSVVILGHGDLATRQLPMYQHWLSRGVEIHCADTNRSNLDDCLAGVTTYVLPDDKAKLAKVRDVDLLCINNDPNVHLATAIEWDFLNPRRIVIQKPQDLNFPLIRTLAKADGYRDLRRRTVIHDHYRNKSVVPALDQALPGLLTERGHIRRMLLLMSESKSVNDELRRRRSIECGMIQDLAVHMFDLLLEFVGSGMEWRNRENDERMHKRIGGEIQILGVHKMRDQESSLGGRVDTFDAIDLHITELIRFPSNREGAETYPNEFDALVVVGKGLTVEQGIESDLKTVAIDFVREGEFDVSIDLKSLTVRGFQNHEINRYHGGLNRPYLLMTNDPPEHAVSGLGGYDYPQWQTLELGGHVAELANRSIARAGNVDMKGYPAGRPLGDLLRQLAGHSIRNLWGDLPSLTKYLSDQALPAEFCA